MPRIDPSPATSSESDDSNQSALLVAEDAVYAGDGLHQSVAAHRLVGRHRVETGALGYRPLL